MANYPFTGITMPNGDNFDLPIYNGETESGGGGGSSPVAILHAPQGILDKTWQEVTDYMAEGIIPVVVFVNADENYTELQIITMSFIDDGMYTLRDAANTFAYITDTADGYPTSD